MYRFVDIYLDPFSNKIYWFVNRKLIYTHSITNPEHKISELYLTFFLHNRCERISIVSSRLSTRKEIFDLIENQKFYKNKSSCEDDGRESDYLSFADSSWSS